MGNEYCERNKGEYTSPIDTRGNPYDEYERPTGGNRGKSLNPVGFTTLIFYSRR